MVENPEAIWTTADSADLYQVPRWGHGYFAVQPDGHLHVHPEMDPQRSIDLKQLVDRLRMRGLGLPLLLRFSGILRNRLLEIRNAFEQAITEYGYQGRYACVYPIKVNQQRHVVEEILRLGSPYGFGLEAGSKPELLAAVAMTGQESPVICNGFKDSEFVEMALLAQKIGRTVIPVVDRYTELELILKHSERLGIQPILGMRVKLAARGSGRWQSSGGYRAKFGLSVGELLRGLEQLKERNMADCFRLLHFHLGSQITNIRHVKNALQEVARVYADLVKRGAGLEYLDVGGGLGVDYDGSQTNFESSVNYTLQEYANDVVHHVQTVFDDAGIAHPTILSESGRAVVAYHSVLVFDVLGVAGQGADQDLPSTIPEEFEQPLHDLRMTLDELRPRNVLEAFHDAQQSLDMAINLFSAGYLPLDQRCLAERLYFAICRKLGKICESLDVVPEELQGLDRLLANTYFCNFSLFQSMPDSWAIKQLFPIMPIHRLKQCPTQHAVLGDITCDSDGKIDQFVDLRDIRRTLPLHNFDGSDYYLGAFLLGAYQEILGDLHNLFGDTNAAHVDLDERGEIVVEHIIKGDTVSDVLRYVQFNGSSLIHRLQTAVDAATREGRIDHRQAGALVHCYEQVLNGYTYLEEPDSE